MRMIAPRTGAPEITLAEDQPEYSPLVVAVYETPQCVQLLLTRWRLEPGELARLNAGEDLYLSVMTFGQPLQPLRLQVGPEGYV